MPYSESEKRYVKDMDHIDPNIVPYIVPAPYVTNVGLRETLVSDIILKWLKVIIIFILHYIFIITQIKYFQ